MVSALSDICGRPWKCWLKTVHLEIMDGFSSQTDSNDAWHGLGDSVTTPFNKYYIWQMHHHEPRRMRWITTFSISYHSLQLTATIGKEPSEEQREALMEGLQTRSGDGFELVCLVTLVPHTRHNDTAEP